MSKPFFFIKIKRQSYLKKFFRKMATNWKSGSTAHQTVDKLLDFGMHGCQTLIQQAMTAIVINAVFNVLKWMLIYFVYFWDGSHANPSMVEFWL